MSNFENLFAYVLIDPETGLFVNLDIEIDDESEPVSYPMNWDEVLEVCEMMDCTPEIIETDAKIRIALVSVNPADAESFFLARNLCYVRALAEKLRSDNDGHGIISAEGFPFPI